MQCTLIEVESDEAIQVRRLVAALRCRPIFHLDGGAGIGCLCLSWHAVRGDESLSLEWP
jgi:hypothetical protein